MGWRLVADSRQLATDSCGLKVRPDAQEPQVVFHQDWMADGGTDEQGAPIRCLSEALSSVALSQNGSCKRQDGVCGSANR